MSEEQTVATESVSEGTAQETTTETTDVGGLIAESKKYRKRSQDAEAQLKDLQSQLAKAEETKLKEKEDFKTLYEQTAGKMETYKTQADKWTSYETSKREALLNSIPEEEKEAMSKLDLETLEFVTNKINNAKANAPQVVGSPRQPEKPLGDWTKMSLQDKKDNWKTIIANAKNKK